jgi:integrase
MILLRRSKTDQEGRGIWLRFGVDTAAASLEWIKQAGISEGYLLRGVLGKTQVTARLGGGQIGRIFKNLARLAKLEPCHIKSISGHSMRVGAAQDMLLRGSTLPQIMAKGGWTKVDTVMRYVEHASQPL